MKNVRTFDERLKEDLKGVNFKKLFQGEYDKLQVGLKLVELREQAGLTQKELASRIHTSQQAVSRLESGVYRGYTLSILEKIAIALGYTLDISFRRFSHK